MPLLFGLTPLQIESIQETFRRHLGNCKDSPVKVWVFGSRATGKHRPYSDLDLLFESGPPPSDQTWDRLAEDFDESDLPFKVDIVLSENLLPAYQERVLAERKLLWNSGT